MLRLKSLGQTLIEADDARLTPTAETVFATALYLIIEAGRPIGREELTRLLWPEVSEAQAQHGLRQALYRLKMLGATIKADRKSITLSPRFCSTDFAPLLAPQSISALEEFADKVGGSFLPGYRPQLSEEFESWVERQRDAVHSAVARALVAGIQAKKRVSDWSGAEQLAGMCLSIDSLNEEATLTMAEAAALGGSKTRALSILNTYLTEIGEGASEIKLPAALLRRRISEAYQKNIFAKRDVLFAGREEEIAELTRALAGADRGDGNAYLISGEPGIGKTRLLSEFTRILSLQSSKVVRVGCQSHDVRRPLSVFVDLVPKLLDMPGALGCDPDSMRFLRRLTAQVPEGHAEQSEYESSNMSYDRARKALVEILEAVCSETCLVLQLEDAHWLDPQSSRMFEELFNWMGAHRILFLLTSRTTAIASDRVTQMRLRPLPGEASFIVAKALARHDGPDTEAFLAWCISSSGGNPYYLTELVREERLRDGKYQAPESLARLLQTRVHMLSAEARSLLEVCCVYGIHSTAQRIEQAIESSREHILRGLGELDASGMIEVDGCRILSRHDLLSSVVLSQMSEAARLMLHRYVAKQLEEEGDFSNSVSMIWESAEHWLSACDAPRAVQLLRRCGNHLSDIGMPEEASRVLERAASLSADSSDKYYIGAERARALMRADRAIDAAEVLQTLITLRASVQPYPSPLDEVGLMSLQTRWMSCGSIPEIIEDGVTAISSPLTSSEERLATGRFLLSAADNLCDSSLGHEVYSTVRNDLTSSKVSLESRLWFQMIYHCCIGVPRLALAFSEELVEYSRQANTPIAVMTHLRHASHVHACHGSLATARSLNLEGFHLASRTNAFRAMAMHAGIAASLHMHEGDIDEAAAWIEHAKERHDPKDQTTLATNLLSHRTELAIRQGRPEEARKYIEHCRNATRESQSVRGNVRSIALEIHLAVVADEPIRDSRLAEFVSLFETVRSAPWQDYSAESLLRGLYASGQHGKAASMARDFVLKHRRDTGELSRPLVQIIETVCGGMPKHSELK